MKKRVFIVHGWEGYPAEGWFPWLKQQLEQRGFAVSVPPMPEADKPRIEKWVNKLAEAAGGVDGNTYFVGHSLGCQAIARYLKTLPEGWVCGGAVFVAGFFKRLTNLEDKPGVDKTARHWLETPLDLGAVRLHLRRSTAIFSNNDPYVPLDNQDNFKDELGSKIFDQESMGHFSGSDGVVNLPVALDCLLEIVEEKRPDQGL